MTGEPKWERLASS